MPNIDYELLATRVYDASGTNRTPVPEGWAELIWQKDYLATGFSAGAYQKGSEIVIAYAGTNQIADWLTGNSAALGLPAPQIFDAMRFYLDIKAANPGASISFTGHSLGGGLASLMAVFFNKPAVVFDEAPFQMTAIDPLIVSALEVSLLATGYTDLDFALYNASFATLFPFRENNVNHIYLDGEVLAAGRAIIPTIVGTDTAIPMGSSTLSALNRHAMTLLTAMEGNAEFATLVQQLPNFATYLLEKAWFGVADRRSPGATDLLSTLLIDQYGAEKNGKLDQFVTDMNQLLVSDGLVQNSIDLRDALMATVMDYFYKKVGGSTNNFFAVSSNGLHFKYSDIGSENPQIHQALANAVAILLNSQTVTNYETFIRLMQQNAWHFQTGIGGMAWTASENDSDAVIGWVGTDVVNSGDGKDLLYGLEGDDDLNGGAGNDELYGGVGNDTLTGGKGNDYLEDVQGFDTYQFAADNGSDTILDTDGLGRIILDGIQIKGKAGVDPSRWIQAGNTWQDRQNHIDYSLVVQTDGSQDLIITANSTSIRIKNWHADNLGIALGAGHVVSPVTSTTFTGDLVPLDQSPNTDGIQLGYDSLGNVIVGGEADPGRQDTLYDSTGNDKLQGLAGDDTLKAERGGNDILEGGGGSDILLAGSSGDHWLYGEQQLDFETFFGQGQTEIASGERGDLLSSGTGNDNLYGSSGQDVLAGGGGADVLVGGGDDDLIYGDGTVTGAQSTWDIVDSGSYDAEGILHHRKQLSGASYNESAQGGNDILYGGNGNDLLNGGLGNDVLDGGAGRDLLYGGDGNDVLYADERNSEADLGPIPTDKVGDFLNGGKGDDILMGGGRSDALMGDEGNDFIVGGAGDDIIFADADYMTLANDWTFANTDQTYGAADESSPIWSVTVGLSPVTGQLDTGVGGDDIVYGGDGGDWVLAGRGNDVVYGEAGMDSLDGGEGDDLLFGGDGDDALNGDLNATPDQHGNDYLDLGAGQVSQFARGGGGSDIIIGGDTDDRIEGDELRAGYTAYYHGDDTVYAKGGNDTVWGEGGSDTIYGGAGNDYLQGDADGIEAQYQGDDQLYGEGGDDTLVGDGGNDSLDGGADNDYLAGGDGNDRLFGGKGNDTLIGDGGEDTLDGGDGNDLLLGGAGDDTYLNVTDEDTINDTEGRNTIRLATANSVGSNGLAVTPFGDQNQGRRLDISLDNGETLKLEGAFFGTDATIEFANGNQLDLETLVGTSLNTALSLQLSDAGGVLYGGAAADTLKGGSGNDRISGALGADKLYGYSGDDILQGGDGNDILDAGDGDDTLIGGAGRDLLLGGIGNDEYQLGADAGGDLITDSLGQNQIRFGNDITPANLTATVSTVGGQTALTLKLAGVELATITQGFGGYGFEFADGKRLTADEFLLDFRTGNGSVYGSNGDDSLIGSQAAENIYGQDGNDTLWGGRGDDALNGGLGADDYRYRLGDGHDSIQETDNPDAGQYSQDRVTFGAGISLSDVEFNRRPNGDLSVTVAGLTDAITVRGWYTDPTNRVENFVFSDGQTVTADTLAALNVTPQQGTAGNDTLKGSDYNDIILAGSGDDLLIGNGGNDELHGEAGTDSYRLALGGGADQVFEMAGETSVIDVSDYELSRLAGTRVGDDLLLSVTGAGDSLTLKNYYTLDHNWQVKDQSNAPRQLAGLLAENDARRASLGEMDRLQESFIAEIRDSAVATYQGFTRQADGTLLTPVSGNVTENHVTYTRASGWTGYVPTSSSPSYSDYFSYKLRYYSSVSEFGVSTFSSDDAAIIVPSNIDSSTQTRQCDVEIEVGQLQYATYTTITPRLVIDYFYTLEEWHALGYGSLPIPYDAYEVPAYLTETTTINRPVNLLSLHVTNQPVGNFYNPDPASFFNLPASPTVLRFSAAVTFYNEDNSVRIIEGGDSGNAIDIAYSYNTIVRAGGGNDSISATGAISDLLDGGSGDDSITGGSNHDIIVGGRGNDILKGGSGDDSYYFLSDDVGTDLLFDHIDNIVQDEIGYGGILDSDTVVFGEGIALADLSVTWGEVHYEQQAGNFVWYQTLDVTWGPNSTVRIILPRADESPDGDYDGYNYVRTGIEFFDFADGSRMTMAQMQTLAGPSPEHAPAIGASLTDRTVTEDIPFTYTLPSDAFVDLDPGEVLSYSQDAWLDWLNFDAETRTFSGIPDAVDIGENYITVTATDRFGASISDTFILTVNPINNITGSDASDTLQGSGRADKLQGLAGPDTLDGAVGDDKLIGGRGDDLLSGGTGNDWLYGGEIEDQAVGTVVNQLVVNAKATLLNDGVGAKMDVYIDGLFKTSFSVTNTQNYQTYTVDPALLGMNAHSIAVAFSNDASAPGTPAQDRNLLVDSIVMNGTTIKSNSETVFYDRGAGNTALDGVNLLNAAGTLPWMPWNGALVFNLDGNDKLDGGNGADTMMGGFGNDIYTVDDAGDVVIENPGGGIDTVRSAIDFDLNEAAYVENLLLLDGAAYAQGNALDNILTGNAADNRLDGRQGNDRMMGGLGDDTYVVDSLGDVVVENANAGVDTIESSIDFKLAANLENLVLTGSANLSGTGTDMNNLVQGNAASNQLYGMAGDDSLFGGDGDDYLDGGTGADTLSGGRGDDVYIVDDSGDLVIETSDQGTDSIELYLDADYSLTPEVEILSRYGNGHFVTTGNNLDNWLYAYNTGGNTLFGLDGDDNLYSYNFCDDWMDGGNGDDKLFGVFGNDTLIGGAGNDTLFGGVGNDTLFGGIGNDEHNGGSGADIMMGGSGDDLYYIDNTGDTVFEYANEGNDKAIVISPISYTLTDGVEIGQRNRAGSLTGNCQDNLLIGSQFDDTLDGSTGNDTLAGGGGNDTYCFGRTYAKDTIVETDSTTGNVDVVKFGTGITADQLWFSHAGNDLEIDIIGTNDKLIVKDWYASASNRIELFETIDGNQSLAERRVDNLVSAMAEFAAPVAGGTILSLGYQTALGTVISENWFV